MTVRLNVVNINSTVSVKKQKQFMSLMAAHGMAVFIVTQAQLLIQLSKLQWVL